MQQANYENSERLEKFPPLEFFNLHPREKRASRANSQREWQLYIATLIVSDLFFTFAAFVIAYWLRFTVQLPFFVSDALISRPFYDNVMLAVIPIWLLIFAAMGLYSKNRLLGGTKEYAAVFNATTLGMFVIITARFTFPTTLVLARGWVLLAYILTFLLTVTSRFLLRRAVYSLRAKGIFRDPALIIGVNEEGKLLAQQFLSTKTSGVHLIGFIQADECTGPVKELGHLDCLGNLNDLESIIRSRNITQLILTSSALTQAQIISIFSKFGTSRNINILMSTGLYEILTTGLTIHDNDAVPLVEINKVRLTGPDQVFKVLLDYLITIPALIGLAPLLAVLALLVRLDSPGPVIYRRRVMGVNGHQFDAFKFRTMDVRSDEILKANPELMREYLENYKLKHDPRVTRIGQLLRKTSLDELPQLFNVLRGEMSLVGPRMITPQELEKYNQWSLNLLTVKPGITGLWQVKGRSDVSYEERVRMDMYYVRNWKIWLDIQLLIQTVPAVLAKRGAY